MFVVVDLEMCRAPHNAIAKEFKGKQEIIQIGAVMLDDNYNVVDTFNTYVCPEHSQLSSKIINLTGIQKHNLIKAQEYGEAIDMFLEWIGEREVQLVTWSDNDERQFRTESLLKNYCNDKFELLLLDVIDCQAEFNSCRNSEKNMSLQEALIIANIDSVGRAHDGFDDAYNTALLFAKIRTEDNIKWNEYYVAASEDSEPLTSSFASLLAGLCIG